MKYDFTQYVTKDSVMSLDGRNKLEVMDQLITRAADLTKLSRDVIFRLTWKREQMMTTGVGGMLALPHIRVNDINHPYVIVGVCENPIEDYQSQDDQNDQYQGCSHMIDGRFFCVHSYTSLSPNV